MPTTPVKTNAAALQDRSDPAQPARAETRYALIESQLAQAICSGRLAPGLVLTEEPLARLFGTSRTPVRTALNELNRQGLLRRFDGRGFLVGDGNAAPVRAELTLSMLGLSASTASPPLSAERIAQSFETALVQALPFGRFQVSEQSAADHFGVSRTVVRELLSGFRNRGLLQKNERSHWIIGPLTAREVAQYFMVRCKLEPLALNESAPSLSNQTLRTIWDQLQQGIDLAEELSVAGLEAIETDMHGRLLAECGNPHLVRMLQQSQIALPINRLFATSVGTRPFAAGLREHAIILEYLMRGSHAMAAQALEEHLVQSARRTRQRLMAISVFPRPELASYLRQRDE